MKPDNIDYFDGGDESQFLDIGTRDRKMKLLTDFLLKTDIEFKIEQGHTSKIINCGEGVLCYFHDAGGIRFRIDDEFVKHENKDKPKVIILDDNVLSMSKYAEEYPENFKEICDGDREGKENV